MKTSVSGWASRIIVAKDNTQTNLTSVNLPL